MVIGSTLRNKNKTSKVSFSFSSEMRPSEWAACILENVLVEIFVFFLFDLVFVTNPERFVFIDSLEFNSLNILSCCSINWIFNLILVEFFSFSFPFLSNFLNLSLDFSLGFLYFLLSSHYLFEIDGIVNKTTVSFNKSLQLIIFAVLSCVFFQE